MSRLISCLVCLVIASACNPSRPVPGDGDAGPVDAPDGDGPDAGVDAHDAPPPPPPPGTAMETVVGAGHATSATMTIDIQLGGGLPGASSTSTETVRAAPSLP